MRKSQFIFVLMLSTSFATMARSDDTSYANCVAAVGASNCVQIGNSNAYYSLSGNTGNQTMTVYGTNDPLSTKPYIPEKAFYTGKGSTASERSSLPEGVTSLKTAGMVSMGSKAFSYAQLTSIDLTGVESLGQGVFSYTRELRSLNLTGMQSIGYEAFADTGLTSVNLTGVQTIGGSAFSSATNLTSVDLTGVQSILSFAFYKATGLTSIVISDSLLDASGNITGIDNSAFKESGLNTIYCPAGKTCANSFSGLSDTPTVISYSKNEDGTYTVGENMYANADMMTKNIACENADQCAALQTAFNAGNTCEAQDACNTLALQYAAPSEPSTPSAPARADIRIYTIDEANAVAGKKNRVSIRYR